MAPCDLCGFPGEGRPAPVLEVATGALFADDGAREGFVGGAGRVYISPRLSVGPELAFIDGERHTHVMLTGNLTMDLVRPAGRQPRPLTPFVVVGVGVFQTRTEVPSRASATSYEGFLTVGGGLRASSGSRVVVGAEARTTGSTFSTFGFLGVRLGP